jgi:hypothetical protein
MNLCEMELHHTFSDQREIGEWFSLSKEDVHSCILLMRLVQVQDAEPSQPLEDFTECEEQNTDVDGSGAIVAIDSSVRQRQKIESILRCHARGIHGKNRILKEIWGVNPGGSSTYYQAKAEYEYLIPFIKNEAQEEEVSEEDKSELRERILQLQARGYGKAKIILELWGVSKGGSQKYKDAEAEYKRLVGEG